MKYLFTFFMFLTTFGSVLQAQSAEIAGRLVAATDGVTLPGAHVRLIDPNQRERTTITDERGGFTFSAVPYGQYRLVISFLGFTDAERTLGVAQPRVEVGTIRLREGGIDLEQVQVSEKVLPVVQKGDTTEFRADAYKTLPDADAADLVQKMPTVTVENGKIQAQGEDVREVLVDGKPFFGNDPTAALRNLPAEVIERIQIFDQQSDQAQFTGIEDGNTTKTINIITRPGMRQGQFGKAYAGYGTDGRYQSGGNVNIFNGDQRISLIGMSNNVNQQNFAAEDLLGVTGSSGGRGRGRGGRGRGGSDGPGGGGNSGDFLVAQQGGITQSHALGINFSDQWGEQLEVNASYFFNQGDNANEEQLNREFVDLGDGAERYTEVEDRESRNLNHRLNAVLDYTIDDRNSLIWRPRLSWQDNTGTSDLLGEQLLSGNPLSRTRNDYQTDLRAANLTSNLLWRHRFEQPRRTFSLNLSNSYAPQAGASNLLSLNHFYGRNAVTDSLNQRATLDQRSWNLNARAMYTEPLGDNSALMLRLSAGWNQQASDRYTYDFMPADDTYSQLNEPLSNVFSNDYLSQSLGAGYNYRKEGLSLMAGAELQRATLDNDQTYPVPLGTAHTFINVLPMVMMRVNMSRTENLRFFYRTQTDLPTLSQLQQVVDNSNPLLLTIGNPGLRQAYQHSIMGRYSATSTESGTVLFGLLSASWTDNYIANATYLASSDAPIFAEVDASPGAQISRPVNLDGAFNARAMLTYGFPVRWLGSNLNVDLSSNFSRTPGLLNEQLNYANNTATGVGLTLASNISDRLDFTLSSRTHYNLLRNSLQDSGTSNYWSQSTRLRFNWIAAAGLVLRTDLTHQQYAGLSADYDDHYLLWNFSIGKKLLPNDRGEVSLTVFDLLRQNNSISRNITETYFEDVQRNVLQQYFMLSFTYNLRHFGSANAPAEAEGRRPRWR